MLSAALTASAAPVAQYSIVTDAADTLLARDPLFNYSKGYNYYESEHFQFIWGNSGDASKCTDSFIKKNAENMEVYWNLYVNDMGMLPPTESVNERLRDGKQYKTNIYISGTGLEGMADDWAYMSYDSGGFAYLFCCVDAMRADPPSMVLPHEFGHVMTAHQLGWNSNKYSYAWWEALANWFREMYLYSDYYTVAENYTTDFFETYLKNLHFTFPFGRDYYAAWPFLQYLTENPDGLEGYGQNFVATMLQQGQVDEYPLNMIDRLAPADLKDTLGHFAKHMAGFDFEHGDLYRTRMNELCAQGSWNWQQIYTMLEPVAAQENVYKVPTERAPQAAGMNIVPLEVTGSTISVTLNGMTDITGADWRACIVQQTPDGKCTYSDLFSDGDTVTVNAVSGASAYLSVIATPDNDTYTKFGLHWFNETDEFSETNVPYSSKQRYPYTVTINGADIKARVVEKSAWESYHTHSNGGGLVSNSANVADTVYVGPDAMVRGNATISGNVRLEDHAVVQDYAQVKDNAVISGYGIVAENAVVSGNARVGDTAMVMGASKISGNAKVIESACIYGNTTMTDNSCAKGTAFVLANAALSGQGVVDGDYYDDGSKTVTKGTAFGWVCQQSYVNARPYTDKQVYAYDFDSDSSLTFNDKYNSTYGISYNSPTWESSRTSAEGVLTLNGTSQYADIDKGALYTSDLDLQISYLDRSSAGEQTLAYLGNSDNYIKVTANGSGGGPEAEFCLNGEVQKLTAAGNTSLGEWKKLSLILDGDTGKLVLNGNTVAQGTITIDPDDIANAIADGDKTAAYRIGADNNGENLLNGSLDFVRIYYGEVAEPSETYSESETISQNTAQVIVGDSNLDGRVNIYDLIRLRSSVAAGGGAAHVTRIAAEDTNGDGSVTVADLVQLDEFLLGTREKFDAGSIVTVNW